MSVPTYGDQLQFLKYIWNDEAKAWTLAIPDKATKSHLRKLFSLGIHSWDSLAKFLRKPETKLHSTACWFLGHYGQRKKDAPIFLELLTNKRTSRVLLWQASTELSLIRSNKTIPKLIGLMKQGNTVDRREAAAYALSWFHDGAVKKLNKVFIEVLRNTTEDPAVRGQVAEGLGNVHLCAKQNTKEFRDALQALIRALDDSSTEVRFWSCFALGCMRNKKAIPPLRKLTKDRTVVRGWWSVSKEARDAIALIQGRNIRDRDRVSRRDAE